MDQHSGCYDLFFSLFFMQAKVKEQQFDDNNNITSSSLCLKQASASFP